MADPAVHHVTPRIGLLMAIHNFTPTMAESVASLMNQNYPEFTLTIVADGATEDVLKGLQNVIQSRLQIIEQSFTGQIGALNVALEKSKPANFYAVVYPHCTYNAQYLNNLMSALMANPLAGGSYTELCRLNCLHEPPYQFTELLSRNLIGYSGLFRLETLKRIGGKFIEHPLGLWESWRQMGAQKPFVLMPRSLLPMIRVYPPTPYEMPQREKADLLTETVPLLKLKILTIGDIETPLLYNLRKEGHVIMEQGKASHAPDLLLLDSAQQLESAQKIALELEVPVFWVLNNHGTFEFLIHYQPWWLLMTTPITQDEIIYQQLLKMGYNAIRYPGTLTPQLAKIPLILNRFKVTTVIRSYIANPSHLEVTLNSLERMDQPSHFGDVMVLCVEKHAAITRWLKERNIPAFVPPEPRYFIYLADLLRQCDSHLVLMIDAGVVVSESWFYRVYPYIWTPRAAMVSSFLHQSEVGVQHLPMRFHSLKELQALWPRYYKQLHPTAEQVPRISDSLFLTKKHLLEYTLRRNPFAMPMEYPDIFSRLFFAQMNLPVIMSKTTYAIQTL